jgi:hypothetical protein
MTDRAVILYEVLSFAFKACFLVIAHFTVSQAAFTLTVLPHEVTSVTGMTTVLVQASDAII